MNHLTNIPRDIPMVIPSHESVNDRSNTVNDPTTSWLYRLYRRTHICPCPEDFNRQLTPQNPQEGTQENHPVYLALYWTNQEHLYRRFMEEEMDLASLPLMTQEDYAYFGMRPF